MADKVADATASMIRNLQDKTGASLDEWVGRVRALGARKHGEVVAHLKTKHGLGHGYANLVAHAAAGAVWADAPPADDLISAQYSGDKAALRPIYDRLAAAVARFGTDVEIAPKKTCVSFRRSKQFALVQASTKTRVDIGIQLPGTKPAGRLGAAGSFSGMVSHRVRVAAVGEVDADLVGWLKQAYRQA